MTREEWLQSAVNALRPMFQDAGHPIPQALHISIGFASRKSAIGQCWSPESSADKRHQIFIAPTHESDLDVLETVAHELCHAALKPGTGHRAPFQRLAAAIGFTAPWKSTPATIELKGKLCAILTMIGPSPHATLRSDSRTKKQKTRLRLFECECGVKVRVARDTFEATCNLCDAPFQKQGTESEES